MMNNILTWLKSWFIEVDRFDVYKPRERLIYKYWDGKKLVSADPLVLYKRMMERGPELSIDIKVSTSASKDAAKAHESLVKGIREVFQVKTLEEGGITDLEAMDVLDHFLIYSEMVKKNSRPSQTLSAKLEDSVSPPVDGQATSNSSDSGSTENAPSTAALTPSPSV